MRWQANVVKTGSTLALAATGMMLFGCTQYNGALGFGSKKDRIRQQAKATGSQDALQPRKTTQKVTPAAPENYAGANPSPVQLVDHRAGSQSHGAPVSAEEASPRAGNRHNLSLYGRLPQKPAGDASKSSPMDSPDNIRRVTFATQGADFDPQVDPTGRYLVYASTQHRENADIYIKRVDGTAVTQLTNDPAQDMMPVFSPDGTKIAFCSNRTGNWDIYIMDLTGGQPVQITNDPADDFHPSFSPDGSKLVYCTFGNQSGQWELVVISLDNTGPKRFIGNGLFPSWSPAGDRILFQRARERGTRWFSLWTLDIVNGEGVRPTEILASANAAAITPRWSPDGQHIVFCTVVDPDASLDHAPQQADIWIVAADGSGRTNLTQSPYANLQPVWGRDGTIYFASNRGVKGAENIWSIRPDRALQIARSASQNNDAQAVDTTSQNSNMQRETQRAPLGVPPLLAPNSNSSASVDPQQ